MYGISTFDTPKIPTWDKIPEPELITLLRDRQPCEPRVQWQLLKRHGWVDLSPTLSDKLEDFLVTGRPVAAVWIDGVLTEFDLRRMTKLPGHNELRRVKHDAPISASRKISAAELDNDPILYKCSDIFRFKSMSQTNLRRTGSKPGPTQYEQTHARWKQELERRRIDQEFPKPLSQSSPSL